MRKVMLPHGEEVPALGLGTWRMGERADQHGREVAALRTALDLGYRLIDTAEMYGEGGAERVIGEALAGALRTGAVAREALFLVSKVYPHHADAQGVQAACERSLQRLGVDSLDLYLLHWRGGVPLAETVAGFERLQQRGLIRRWGVSNFDGDDLAELALLPGGAACSANQVYYSLSQRGVEFDVAPWQRARGMPLIAYSPIDQGALAAHPSLRVLAERHGAQPAQIALAWLFARPGTIAIPKAVREAHLRENLAAADLVLAADELAMLDRLFPPPQRKQPLAIL
ncbi:aldo/keto reductase [Aquincola sp. MAHUQ-54]|uniref:Aldo/keto reductase n=1 Tax=Aquincola agrisoli TaxID=3119538 RepID=A0AAW9QHZ9_9BURK